MRSNRLGFLILAFSLLFAATPLFAHHSFMAEFDLTKPITLDGVVTKFVWMNPHAMFNIDVTDESGKVTNWTIETACPKALVGRGWTRNSMKPGDRITIEGYLSRNGTPALASRTVRLANGQKLNAESDGVRP